MLFNSFVFWAFFLVVFPLYWAIPHRWQNRLLLVASYVFYGYWDWRFLFLLAFSTAVDFWAGLALGRTSSPGTRRLLVTISIATNLGALGFFKYYDFFATEIAALLQTIGLDVDVRLLNIILPVGISFYTFQSLSYTIDIYRRLGSPISNFPDFALYVAFFPQLVAGPIERAFRLLPQIRSGRRFDRGQASEGLFLIACGIFKKLIVADNLASIVERTYTLPYEALTGPEILVGTYAFAFQIYADFSGYSDIARGLAKLLGIELMINFRHPYVAVNPADFWHRWHISLSTWLRDYLYIPLGGNRRGTLMTYRNLILTMLLGGLWHGAAWNFVLWGAFHGLLLAVHRLLGWRAARKTEPGSFSPVVRFLKIIGMFHVTCYGWLLFRADSFEQILRMTVSLFRDWSLDPLVVSVFLLTVAFSLPVLLGHLLREKIEPLRRKMASGFWQQPVFYAGVIVSLLFFGGHAAHVFIYFQF